MTNANAIPIDTMTLLGGSHCRLAWEAPKVIECDVDLTENGSGPTPGDGTNNQAS